MSVLVVLPLDVQCGVCGKPGARLEMTMPEKLTAGDAPKAATEMICGNCGSNVIFGDVQLRIEEIA